MIENLRIFFASKPTYAKTLGMPDVGKIFQRDLSGEEFLRNEDRAKNVLIILIEGLSYAHVRPFEKDEVSQ